jgi:hypothetical protein
MISSSRRRGGRPRGRPGRGRRRRLRWASPRGRGRGTSAPCGGWSLPIRRRDGSNSASGPRLHSNRLGRRRAPCLTVKTLTTFWSSSARKYTTYGLTGSERTGWRSFGL